MVEFNRDDIKAAGYDYDACGTDIFVDLKVEDGDVVLPSGKRYRILVMPDHAFLRPALARKLRDLVYEGATVLGPKPKYTPSLEGFPASEKEVTAIGEEVWGKCDGLTVTSNPYGKGQVFYGVSPAEVLKQFNIAPAVKIPADCPELAWINRKTEDADIYFISNQSDKNVKTVAGFRLVGKEPEFWDAVNVSINTASGWTVEGEHTQVPLNLMPDESVFVVFRNSGKPKADPFVSVEGPVQNEAESLWNADFKADKEVQLRSWSNGSHILHRATGKTKSIEVTEVPDALELTGPWKVKFQKGRAAPEEISIERLLAWDKHPDPGIRYFSGTARYALEFDVPQNYLKENQEVWLDLGEVEVIAELRVNGENLGVLWNKPFRIELSKALNAGANYLEIDVTNLWVNRLIGDEQYTDDCDWAEGKYLNQWPDWLLNGQQRPESSRVTFTTWKHWEKDEALSPSGLMGPVKLRCAKLISVK